MVDSESIKKSLEWESDEDLRCMLSRAAGASTRIIDELVQEFFEKPYGTPIPVIDHHHTRQADEFLFDKLARRIEQEHETKFHRECKMSIIYIVRDEPTMYELVKEEFIRRTGAIPEPPKILFKYKLKYR